MKSPRIIARPVKHPKFKFVVDLRALKAGRKFFRFREEAEAYASQQSNIIKRHGETAAKLPQHKLAAFIEASEKMAVYGETIADAVAFRVDYLERIRRCKVTVTELVTELLEAKRKAGRAEIYIRSLRNILIIFSRDFGSRSIASITVEEIDKWLHAQNCSNLKTLDNFRKNISVLFGYAARRRMIDSNPVTHIDKPKLPDKSPEIFKVDELRSLLEAANRVAPDVLPMLAIGAFAGVRDAEIKRLDWHEIDLTRGHIEIKGAKAKSARRRIIPIQPNLAAWLRPYSEKQGRLIPGAYRRLLDSVREEAKLARWPNNGLRHSFASYRLAATQNAPLVASELGHTSPLMLYSTYREVVLPSEAQRYWKIEPTSETEKVVAFKAGA